jgi:hypothetical protein
MQKIIDELTKQLQERGNQLLGSDPQWTYIKGQIDGITKAQEDSKVGVVPKKEGK